MIDLRAIYINSRKSNELNSGVSRMRYQKIGIDLSQQNGERNPAILSDVSPKS